VNDEAMTLSDGRKLGFRCLGDREGVPLLFFHGTPGTRFALSDEDAIARVPGIHFILPERPGYGISDPQPARVLLDYPDDIEQLADHLGIASFAVAGGSGGGPHALACAYKLEQRVTTVLLFSSPSPAGFAGATRGLSYRNRLGLFLGQYAPWLLRRMMNGYASMLAKNPDRLVDAMYKQMPPADRAILEAPAGRKALIRDLHEAYRQGAGGHFVDSALAMTSRDWGFNLKEIKVPVHLWHGEHDTLVSPNMARYLAAEIPECTANHVAGAGHVLTETPEVVEAVSRILVPRAV
jgi:pimeloyl-ACP methyl ester carboxylesterase